MEKFKKIQFRLKWPWSVTDCVLLSALILATVLTVLIAILILHTNVIHGGGGYERREAGVGRMMWNETRCDKCVNSFVGWQYADYSHDGYHDDHHQHGASSLVNPDWWAGALKDPEELKTMEYACPLVQALYVIVTYSDRKGIKRKALLHKNDWMKRNYRMNSFSPCEKLEHRRHRRSTSWKSGHDGEDMHAAAERLQRLHDSRETLRVYVNRDDPDQAVEEYPYCSLWKSAVFDVLFVLTMVLLVAFFIRRRVVRWKAQKVGDGVQEGQSMGKPVKVEPGQLQLGAGRVQLAHNQAQKEKDPSSLGPELYLAVPYDAPRFNDMNLLSRGLREDGKLGEKKEQQAALSPLDLDGGATSPPPPYSSLG